MFCKSLIQFSVSGWGYVSSLLFDLSPNYGGVNEDNGIIQGSRLFSCGIMTHIYVLLYFMLLALFVMGFLSLNYRIGQK